MQIEKISISNFENLEGSWKFGTVTELRGRNGAGKSALGRAIGWCLTGLDAYGDRRMDHVMRDPREPAVVILRQKDGKEVKRAKTLNSNILTVDGMPVDPDHFGDPHLLLSSFMPGYFQDLDEKQKRKLFMDLLPPVDMVALFRERTSLDAKAQGAMGIDFAQDPAKLHKRWASTRLDKQKELEQLKGGESELALRVGELEARLKEDQASEDTTDLAELERQGKDLQAKLLGLKDKMKAHQEWEQKDAVYQAKAEDRKQYQDQVDKALDGLTPEELTEQLEAADKEMERLEVIRDKRRDWEGDVRNREDAKELYEAQLRHLDYGRCFTCKSKLNEKTLNVIREELLDSKEPGKEPPKPVGLDEAQKFLQSLKDRYSLGKEFTGFLETRPLPPDPGPAPCEWPDPHKIEDLEDTLRGVRDNYAAAKATVKATKESMEIQHVQARNDLQANKELQVETSGQVDRLQAVEDALHPAKGVFAQALEKQLKGVKELLPAWVFILSEATKTTGKENPCFKEWLLVNVPDQLGVYREMHVPLKYCSAGQQLRAGMDLCAALDNLNGNKLGMLFCDNVELLSKEGALTVDEGMQVFKAYVADSDLKVEVVMV